MHRTTICLLVAMVVGCATAPIPPAKELQQSDVKTLAGTWTGVLKDDRGTHSTFAVIQEDGSVITPGGGTGSRMRVEDGKVVFETGLSRVTLTLHEDARQRLLRGTGTRKATGESFTLELTPGRTIQFHEISLQLPGPEWWRDEKEAPSLDIRRGPPGRQPQSISLWPVGVPPALRTLSLAEHASKYFEAERHLPRYEGRWEGFAESEREIAGRRYPVMTYRVTGRPNNVVTDGLFLLYFPEDFPTRQRFYVVMWMDYHLENAPARALDELDAVVASLRVRPLGQ